MYLEVSYNRRRRGLASLKSYLAQQTAVTGDSSSKLSIDVDRKHVKQKPRREVNFAPENTQPNQLDLRNTQLTTNTCIQIQTQPKSNSIGPKN